MCHPHVPKKETRTRVKLNARINFPKTPGAKAGMLYAIEVALLNQNWNAALAMLPHIKLEDIERELRLDDDSILDGVKVKEMPKELKKVCKAAVATVDMEFDQKVCRVKQLCLSVRMSAAEHLEMHDCFHFF